MLEHLPNLCQLSLARTVSYDLITFIWACYGLGSPWNCQPLASYEPRVHGQV
jgi:hypothetical protein